MLFLTKVNFKLSIDTKNLESSSLLTQVGLSLFSRDGALVLDLPSLFDTFFPILQFESNYFSFFPITDIKIDTWPNLGKQSQLRSTLYNLLLTIPTTSWVVYNLFGSHPQVVQPIFSTTKVLYNPVTMMGWNPVFNSTSHAFVT